MIDGSIISGLANTSFFWFAFAIGAIVSFDVAVLEFTRKYDGESLGNVDPERNRMRILHPLFHGGSFFVYTIVILILQAIPWKIPDIIDVEIPKKVVPAFMYFIFVMVFIFVWMTYKEKIAEDNSSKTGAASDIKRFDMRGLVSLTQWVAKKFGKEDAVLGAALAGAVAVDMLAISALIKDFVLPTKYGSQIAEPISRLSGFILIDLVIFSIIISAVVFVAVIFAQELGKGLRHDSRWTIPFRLLEPLVVFFIGLEAVRATVGYMQSSFDSGVHEYSASVDILFALTIVISLIIGSGKSPRELWEIWRKDNFEIDLGKTLRDATIIGSEGAPEAELAQVIAEKSDYNNERARKIFVWVSFTLFGTMSVIFCSILISYWTVYPSKPHNHLVEATSIFSAVFSVIVTAIMYSPSRNLDKFETDEDFNFEPAESAGNWSLIGPIIGAIIGAISLVIFGTIYFGRTTETDVIGLWLGYLIFVWLLFQLRTLRFHRRGDINGVARRASDADFSELISAFGVASSAVALVGTLWATGLLARIVRFDIF